MPISGEETRAIFRRLREKLSPTEAGARLSPDPDRPLKPRLRPVKHPSLTSLAAAWRLLRRETPAREADQAALADPDSLARLEAYGRSIETMVGTVKLPVGVVGPLRVNGLHAHGDYYVPLATTEAALVASYGRGAWLVSQAGGCTAAQVSEGMLRSPGFAFASVLEAGLFVEWAVGAFEALKQAAEAGTRHGRLTDIQPHLEGDHVYLVCRYTTGDAAGQNMTTLATEALCRHILSHSPVKPLHWFIEANFSGDKKASSLGFLGGRGRKVTATALLPATLIEEGLRTSVERMIDYWRMAALGGVMSGTVGVQGHYANGLAALYIATGQDAACVAESSVGVTRMEERDGALFVSVTLPNLVVGTVGGGTALPSQSACLSILGLAGAGNAPALAEVTAALCLAGEVSIIGALCAGDFTRAHRGLARER